MPESVRNQRRQLLPALVLLAASAALGGCGDPWKDNFHLVADPAATRATSVRMTSMNYPDLDHFETPAGLRKLGESRFERSYRPDTESLKAFAASIGATHVYWAVEFARTESVQRYYEYPRDVSNRGSATITQPDGSQQHITIDNSATVWESVPYTQTDNVYRYLALFFVEEQRPPGQSARHGEQPIRNVYTLHFFSDGPCRTPLIPKSRSFSPGSPRETPMPRLNSSRSSTRNSGGLPMPGWRKNAPD